ncbi:hypothetical protein QWY84_01575 [Aquisalimonas lutea]|uniref:hypothetical protein n=1 Tax=Aquisalimonas lutea TaxID=1327750 RepID=UPI0025B52F8C|nr:hypothetical protein [Aquisalimonas lutea]MDN3516290.1 hypothetical protein [Aquisalimonas lutea]
MAVWRCELTPETVARIRELVSAADFPDTVTVDMAESTSPQEVRERAAREMVAKVPALGGTRELDVMMALTDRSAMHCTPEPG